VTLESQVGVVAARRRLGAGARRPRTGHFAGRVVSYGIGPSFTVYDQGRTRIAPVVELVGWHVMDGNVTRTD
jgi:hypothetical protein